MKNIFLVSFFTALFLSFTLTLTRTYNIRENYLTPNIEKPFPESKLTIPKHQLDQIAGIMTNFCIATQRKDSTGQKNLATSCLQLIYQLQCAGVTGIEQHPPIQHILKETNFLDCWSQYHGTLQTLFRALSNNPEHTVGVILHSGIAIALRNGVTIDTDETRMASQGTTSRPQNAFASQRGYVTQYDPLNHTLKPLTAIAGDALPLAASFIKEINRPFPLDDNPKPTKELFISNETLTLAVVVGCFLLGGDSTHAPELHFPAVPTHRIQ